MSVPDDFFDSKGVFVPESLVSLITSDPLNNGLKTPITVKGGDTIWHYKHELGIWKDDGIAHVKDFAKEVLGKRWKTAYVNEVVYGTLIATYIQPEDFVEDLNLLVVKNGTLHLDTMELTEHNWMDYAKSALPITYNPDAECPEILKFLTEVIPDAIDTFQEWIGYHLYRNMIYHKAAMFIGDGANGKTTLQDVMNAFLGHDNISQVGLYHLTSNRFAASDLYGKLANISPEIASDELKRTGVFKSLTGHDRIRAEKKHQDAFSFTSYAKLTFLCNQLPTTPDMSRAFFRRWLLFVFPNKFEDPNCDPKILKKLTTPEELSGLMNWAIKGLNRLQDKGTFTKSLNADEMQELYESMSDPITAFINGYIKLEPPGIVSKDDVYQAYHQFCRGRGYTNVSKGTLTTEIKARIRGVLETKRKLRGKQQRCWQGMRLKIRGTLEGRRDALYSRDLSSTINTINKGVPSVPSVPKTVEKSVPAVPPQEKYIFTDAEKVLKEHGGRMHQEDLFQALLELGHHYIDTSLKLRGDSRFRFMGVNVKYLGEVKP